MIMKFQRSMLFMTAVCLGSFAQSSSLAQSSPPPATSPVRATIALEVFAKLPSFENPKLSPDGTKIAAKFAIRQAQHLVIISLDGKTPPAVFSKPEGVDVNWWQWTGNNWLAVGLGAREFIPRFGQELYITRVMGVSADMKTLNRVDWPQSGQIADMMLWTARDGSARILQAKQTGFARTQDFYPSVFEADLSTGKAKLMTGAYIGVLNWLADGNGVLRLGYSYSDTSRSVKVMYRNNEDSDFRTIVSRPLGEDDEIVLPLIFETGDSAITLSERDGRKEVYRVSLPDLTLSEKLRASNRYDIAGVLPNALRNGIDGYQLQEKSLRNIWINPQLAAFQRTIDDAVGADNGRIISMSDDRTKLLFRVGGASQAGTLYYWDTSAGNPKRLAWFNDTLRDRALSPVRSIEYTSRDGLVIEAVLTMPRGRPVTNLPLIVLPHGGPRARDDERWDWWTQYLAELGYAVIQPNYRGSSGYGAEFAKKGEGEWGMKMQDDLNDAVDALVKLGIADPKRVCMVGASYGGYAAMRAAQRDGARYRCAISYAGVSDLGGMRRYDRRFLNSGTRGEWLQRQAPDFRAISPLFSPGRFSSPILIVHGNLDRVVPIDQSRDMAEALKKAGKPYEYVEQPLGDHHFSREADRIEFLQRMTSFLAKYNPS